MSEKEIKFRCSYCTSEITAPASMIGKKVYCKACYRQIVVPAESSRPLNEEDPSLLYAVDRVPTDVRDAAYRSEYYEMTCPVCRSILALTEKELGKTTECPDCGTIINVPADLSKPKKLNEFDTQFGITAPTTNEVYGIDGNGINYTLLDGNGKKVEFAGTDSEYIPKPDEFGVYCPLCETLQYTTPDKIGKKIKCSECEREFVVRPRVSEAEKKQEQFSTVSFEGSSVYGLEGDSAGTPGQANIPPDPAKDPNLVEVVCKLCGTIMYAPKSMIGQKKRCPDCYTETEIKDKTADEKIMEERILPQVNETYGTGKAEAPKVYSQWGTRQYGKEAEENIYAMEETPGPVPSTPSHPGVYPPVPSAPVPTRPSAPFGQTPVPQTDSRHYPAGERHYNPGEQSYQVQSPPNESSADAPPLQVGVPVPGRTGTPPATHSNHSATGNRNSSPNQNLPPNRNTPPNRNIPPVITSSGSTPEKERLEKERSENVHPSVKNKKKKRTKPQEVMEGGVTAKRVGDNVFLVAPRPPEYPMINGLFRPLADLNLWMRVVMSTTLNAIIFMLLVFVIFPLFDNPDGPGVAQGKIIVMVPLLALCSFLAVCSLRILSLYFMAIFMSTSTGAGPVQEWPEEDFVSGMIQALWLLWIMLVSAVPAAGIVLLLNSVNVYLATATGVFAFCFFFPIAFLSSLQSNGMIITGTIIMSLFRCFGTWLAYYILCLLLVGIPAAGWLCLPLGSTFGLVGLPVLTFCPLFFCLLLGRLAWVIADDVKYRDEE